MNFLILLILFMIWVCQPVFVACIVANHGVPFLNALGVCMVVFGVIGVVQLLVMNKLCK